MLGSNVIEHGTADVVLGVLIGETAFFLYAPGFCVSFIVATPDFFLFQAKKCIFQYLSDCLRYDASSPKRNSEPIAKFTFRFWKFQMALSANHETQAADSAVDVLQNNGKRVRGG